MPWQIGTKHITDGRAYRWKYVRLNIVKLFVSYVSLRKNPDICIPCLGLLTKWAFNLLYLSEPEVHVVSWLVKKLNLAVITVKNIMFDSLF